MNNTRIVVQATAPKVDLVPRDADKHTRYRLRKFEAWLANHAGTTWYRVDLARYRDHLLAEGYAASTVSAHLSTIRARYRELIRDRDLFYRLAAQRTDSVLERKAVVDELIARLENAIDPEASRVKQKTSQDVADTQHLRLTSRQASRLMAAPGLDTLKGLRDTAIIALMLCTGIREAELCNLEVRDLRQRLGGELALHVRQGKGCKERLIPYGQLDWVLAIVDKWLETAGITAGPVFRGFYKNNRTLRPGRLSVRAVQYILASYPITIDGQLVTVRPHDLRRTYARRLYEAGVDLLSIQQNLGHVDSKTTLGYIGTLDADKRRPPAVYTFDLSALAKVPQPATYLP